MSEKSTENWQEKGSWSTDLLWREVITFWVMQYIGVKIYFLRVHVRRNLRRFKYVNLPYSIKMMIEIVNFKKSNTI
jgi:hypothetical protein